MADQHVGSGDIRGLEQGMEVVDRLGRGARHRYRVAPAWQQPVLDDRGRSRPVVGADAGEGGDAGENHRARRLRLDQVVAPEVGTGAEARLQHHGRTALSGALQVEPAATPISTRPE